MSWYGDAWDATTDFVGSGGPAGWAVDKFFKDDPSITGNNKLRPLRIEQGGASGRFADASEDRFGQIGQESAGVRNRLSALSRGQHSLSAEQLRQGLQQQQAMQQSMAASARPNNAAMAARTAAMQAGRNSSGMAGNQAMAGIAERNAATAQLGQMLQGQSALELQASLGGRQTAVNAYQAETAGKSGDDKLLGAATAAGAAYMMSDRRLKKNIKDGRDDADELISALKSYRYDYKDEKHGKGGRFGIMAQDLEKTRAGRSSVVTTSEGKAVHGASLASAVAAATGRLGERLAKLESKK